MKAKRLPDKLPEIDPRTPRLYSVILETADRIRAERRMVDAMTRAAGRAAHSAWLAEIKAREAARDAAEEGASRPRDPVAA